MAIKIGDNTTVFKVGSTDVDAIYLGDTLIYSSDRNYFAFRAKANGTFSFTNSGMSYSLDSGRTWNTLTAYANTPTVQSGSTIMWKAALTSSYSEGIGTFSSTGQFEVEGNIMSLKYGDNFSNKTTLPDEYSFANLFYSCGGLTNAENLILPATALTYGCYMSLFDNCYNLTTAPVLPATTLAQECYHYTFASCNSLTTAPELPATTLAQSCYNGMFQYCNALTATPVLSAATLVGDCYGSMFQGCNNLSSVTCLATDISASYSTEYWLDSVASTGTFYKNPSMNSWTLDSENGVPSGWTVQNYSS